MLVTNIHERQLAATPEEVGSLLDTLASEDDRLWPTSCWPAMRLDRSLAEGASGGHGPISYLVEEYRPGRLVKFRFLGPRGFHGHHWLEVVADKERACLIRHTIHMRVRGMAWLSWSLVIRPLHDALLEDALALAEASLGTPPRVHAWSWWVKCLRWIMSRGRASQQQVPVLKPRSCLH